MKRLLYSLFFALSFFSVNSQTVVDIIVDSPDHNTLEAAVVAAGLVDALSVDGPITVFAPTDDAFDALPDGTVETLLEDPQGALTNILLNHVVGSEVLSTDLVDATFPVTLNNGKYVTVEINENGVFISGAQVTMADIPAENGVVHVIDAVILPPSTVADVIINSDAHNTLEAAVLAAGLVPALNSSGPFTVFAPTDDAFAALPDGTVETLLEDPQGALTDILLYHVVPAQVESTDLSDGQTAVTLNNGKTISVSITTDGVFINGAQVIIADVPADNGVVHVIDAVLLPPRTVADIIIESEVHNTLEAAVGAAGLVETLNGAGPFTVFAPTDDAFAALPDGTVETLLEDPEGALTEILLYHVVGGVSAASTDLSDGMMIETVNGKSVEVTIDMDGNVFINDAQVIIADLPADNGIVHVIDAVLLPPRITVVDVIVNSDVHNTLEAAVVAAGLVDALNGEGPFTVFAPTDAAFDALPDGTVETLLEDPQGALTDILLYHVVPAQVESTDLSDGQTAVTLNNGKTISVSITTDGVFINGAQVIMADVPADNGVVHVIDAVLLPPRTVADVIIESDVHNILEAAVGAAGLVETLNGAGPFTVFAPTDDAFAALPDGTVETLLQDPEGALTEILLYHVVGGISAASTDLSDGMMIETVNGKSVEVTIDMDGNVFINDAQVIIADLPADNGIVHVIDAVLLPPRISVVDIIVNSDVHNTLEAAVGAAGLVETLDGEGPFTVFAPTDAAFDLLPEGTVETLLEDPQGALTDILLYHVVAGTALSTDLMDGMMVETVNGKNVEVSIDMDGNVFINDAQVIIADIPADNGVVHVIDAVLLPPRITVVDIIVNSDVHNTLEAAVGAAGLVETLNGEGPFTVFAPTDAAFDLLPEGTVEMLLEDPTGALTDILLYHVVSGQALSTDLTDGQMVETINGQEVSVSISSDGIFINDAQVIMEDIQTDNGVVHVIDAVLLPSTSTEDFFSTPENVNVYPNPADNMVTITYPEITNQIGSVELMDLNGRLVWKLKVDLNNNSINVSEYEPGSYLLKLSVNDRFVYKRLIIQ